MGYADIQWEQKEPSYVRLMRDLERTVFSESEVLFSQPVKKSVRGQAMIIWPVSFEVDVKGEGESVPVSGQLVHVPEKIMTTYGPEDAEEIPEPNEIPASEEDKDNPEPSEEDPEEDPMTKLVKPSGHLVYAWNVIATIPVDLLSKALVIAKEMHKTMTRIVEGQLKGKVIEKERNREEIVSKFSVDQDVNDETIAVSRGLFTSLISPDSVPEKIAAEDKNIRGILPPNVR